MTCEGVRTLGKIDDLVTMASGEFRGSFPAPDRAVLGVLDLTDPLEPAVLQDSRRCVGLLQRVGSNESHASIGKRECGTCCRSFRRVASPLKGGHDSVRDLHHAVVVRWPLETHATDNDAQ